MKNITLFIAVLVSISWLLSACANVDAPAKEKNAVKQVKKSVAALSVEESIKRATTPVQHGRHVKRHIEKKAYAAAHKDQIKILMIGDSITHQWEYAPAATTKKKYLDPYNVLNLGCGGDRTQHTIWIIEKSGILDLVEPKLITVMIGTNNATRTHYKGTVAGIRRIIDSLRKRYPEAKILLYAIFPRGTDNNDIRRIENHKVNAEIVKFCDGKNVIWVDICKDFLTPQGILERSMMPDLLHPRNPKGYSVWGDSLLPYFKKYGK